MVEGVQDRPIAGVGNPRRFPSPPGPARNLISDHPKFLTAKRETHQ